jgi:hypothetical protein
MDGFFGPEPMQKRIRIEAVRGSIRLEDGHGK